MKRSGLAAQIADQTQQGLDIRRRFGRGAGRHAAGADPVKLEIVHMVVTDHPQAGVPEPVIVLGPGQREAVLVRLEALLQAVLHPLLFGLTVAAPGREPHPHARLVLLGRLLQGGEAVGEALVEAPQRRRIVPAIVRNEGIHHDLALLDQLLAEQVDHFQSIRLQYLAQPVAEVVPTVVMEEGPIGLRPLPLDIVQERPPKLARRSDAHHRTVRLFLAHFQRRSPRQIALHNPRRVLGRLGQRVLKGNEEIANRDGRAVQHAGKFSRPRLHEHDFTEIDVASSSV